MFTLETGLQHSRRTGSTLTSVHLVSCPFGDWSSSNLFLVHDSRCKLPLINIAHVTGTDTPIMVAHLFKFWFNCCDFFFKQFYSLLNCDAQWCLTTQISECSASTLKLKLYWLNPVLNFIYSMLFIAAKEVIVHKKWHHLALLANCSYLTCTHVAPSRAALIVCPQKKQLSSPVHVQIIQLFQKVRGDDTVDFDLYQTPMNSKSLQRHI